MSGTHLKVQTLKHAGTGNTASQSLETLLWNNLNYRTLGDNTDNVQSLCECFRLEESIMVLSKMRHPLAYLLYQLRYRNLKGVNFKFRVPIFFLAKQASSKIYNI